MTRQFIERRVPFTSEPYALVRPEIDERDVQAVRRWLFRHADGGWLQCDDLERIEAARRLMFARRLVLAGTVSG